MNTQKTYGIKDEELPWRALAEAVIVQAVKDYRICSQRIRQIQNRLHRCTGITPTEAIEQKWRLILFSNRTGPLDHRPSGHASLFLSSLRAYRSFLYYSQIELSHSITAVRSRFAFPFIASR